MSESKCPAHDQLLALTVGNIPPEIAEPMLEHVAKCPACQTALGTLSDASDTLVASLRRPPAVDPYRQEADCHAALTRAERLAGETLSQAGDSSKSLPGRPVGTAAGTGHATSAPPASGPPTASEQPTAPAKNLGRLGEYELLEELGRGGMGTVYKALHRKLGRIVALKVLPQSHVFNEQAVARFNREMRAVGALDHPNIVRATDAGEHGGAHFLVMEFIEGIDLADTVRRIGRLRISDACELMRQVALGLQCAHEHGLVHRDIKPANVMLTRKGQVKLLDLGLARFRAEGATVDQMTATGQLMGTADFMAPEQISDTHSVDIRADIYSLGCTLFTLLVGHAPFEGPDYPGFYEKMSGHLHHTVRPVTQFRDDVPKQVTPVVKRMMAKAPSDRFSEPVEVAGALAPLAAGCDLPALWNRAQRAVEQGKGGRAVSPTRKLMTSPKAATVTGPQDRRRKPAGARRRWWPWAVAAGLMLAGAGVVAAAVLIRILRDDNQEVAITVPHQSEVTVDREGGATIKLPPAKTVTTPAEEKLPAPTPGVTPKIPMPKGPTPAKVAPEEPVAVVPKEAPKTPSRPKQAPTEPEPVPAKPKPSPAEPKTVLVKPEVVPAPEPNVAEKPEPEMIAKPEPKAPAPAEPKIAATPEPKTKPEGMTIVGPGGKTTKIDAPEGSEVTFDPPNKVTVKVPSKTEVASVRPEMHIPVEPLRPVIERIEPQGIAFTPGMPLGKEALVAEPAALDGVQTWTVETPGHRGAVFAIAYHPKEPLLATGCADGAIRLFNVETGDLTAMLLGHDGRVRCLAWSPDGTVLASGSSDGTARLWNPMGGRLLRTFMGHAGEVAAVAWSPDGTTLAAGDAGKTIWLWKTANGDLIDRFAGHQGLVRAVAFSPDGKTLASGSDDRTVRLWDPQTGKTLQTLQDPEGYVVDVAWSRDGARLATAVAAPGRGCSAKIYDIRLGGQMVRKLPAHQHGDRCLAWSGNGRLLATAGLVGDGQIRVWDASSGTLLGSIAKPSGTGGTYALSFSPDGRSLAAGGDRGVVQVWESVSGRPVRKFPAHASEARWAAFSPDQTALACAYYDGTVRVWWVESGEPLRNFSCDLGPIDRVAYSGNGELLAVGSKDNPLVEIWNLESRDRVEQLRSLRDGAESLAWSPDGTRLAIGGRSAQVWDAASGTLLMTLRSQGHGLGWSPDGAVLAASNVSDLHLFDPGDGRSRRTLFSARGALRVVAWSSDGEMIAAGSEDGKVYLWNPDTRVQPLFSLANHQGAVDSLCWLEGGSTLVSGSRDATCLWHAGSGALIRSIPVDGGAIAPKRDMIASRDQSTVRLRALEKAGLHRTIVALDGGRYLALSRDGHFCGSTGVDEEVVFVVQTEAGQTLLSAEQFQTQYHWRNDPLRVGNPLWLRAALDLASGLSGIPR